MTREDLQQLQQLRQLSVAFQLALKGTTPQVRVALQKQGFNKTKRVILQRHLYNLVGFIDRVGKVGA